jgi:spermidine synthase
MAVLFGLFFISGLASLIYQTVWIRKFSLILGGTTYSMSIVVSTFMAGLALGAAVIGRFADRSRRPLAIYAGIELGIGACALILNFTDPLRERMVRAWIDTPALEGTLLIRVGIVLLWLGLPCFLIGGTLPVMVRFVVRRLSSLGQQVGSLYFINTLGAAVGALLTGYVLIERLGLSGSTFVAVGINVLVAALALWVGKQAEGTDEAAAATPPDHAVKQVWNAGVVVPAVAFFFSGFCALLLEMSWTRLLLGFLHAGVLIISTNLFIVLLGFAIGGVAISRIADRAKQPGALAALLFAGTALMTLAGLGSIEILNGGWSSTYQPRGLELSAMVGLMLPATLFMGATFPVLVRLLVTDKDRIGTQLGGFYAINTVGTVLGGVAAPFFFIPRIGTASSVLVAVGLQLLVALVLLLQNWSRSSARVRFGTLGVVLLAGALVPSNLDIYHRALTADANASLPNWSRERAYVEGPDSTVILYEANAAGQRMQFDDNHFRIRVNASPLVAFDTNETKLMAHLPLLAVPDPKRALVICFGMGNTFRSALAHDIEVDVVDINGAIPGLAKIHQKDPSKTFENPKGHITINDGRNFLLLTPHRYDMITIDPAPPVWTIGLGNIQSREFYQLMADRLTDQGVVEAWMLAGLAGDYEATLAAFRSVFPYIAVFSGVKYSAYHVLGSRSPIRISAARLNHLFSDPLILADLGETDIKYFSEALIKKQYVTDEHGVDEVIKGIAPLTDDRPILEYRVSRGLVDYQFAFPKRVFKPLEIVP